jgi:threonine dehydrogenase-like Zn-dependent dehydrogenase
MKALCWHGKQDVRIEEVPEPRILNPRDAIVKVTSTAICGADLHLYNHFVPTVEKGDILGHEFVGEVVDVGPGVKNLKSGDRVVVPFPIACGQCHYCRQELTSLCENSNPNAWMAEKLWGHAPAGVFGYSHLLGGYAGGQAEYVRVPFADVGPLKIPEGLRDEQVLFLSDVLPTGWMAAEHCGLSPGDTVAVWGCGPVGQFAVWSAFRLGAKRVIAIDRIPHRLHLTTDRCGAETINFEEVDVLEALDDMTGGRGPDACIDAVGMEAHGMGALGVVDRAKQALLLETDRPAVLRQTLMTCRSGGTVSVAGSYGGAVDTIPIGSATNRSLTVKTGMANVHRYMRPLLERIRIGELDPRFIITHRMRLDSAADAYATFESKAEDCLKVVLTP